MSGMTRAHPSLRWSSLLLIVFLAAILGVVAGCGGDDDKKQSTNPVPVLSSVSPNTAVAGGAGFTLTANGTGFVSGSTVNWNGAARATTFVSDTLVKAAIAAVDVAAPASVSITVINPAPNGGASNALVFVVSERIVPVYPEPVTVAPDGSPPNGPSINGGLSYLGRHAIFASKASNLVPDDTNGAWDVFVRDTCRDYWTDELLDVCTPKTTRVSVAPDGAQANGDSGSTVTSPGGALAVSFDGRYIAFVSSATNLVADDTNGTDDVFLRDTCHDDRFGSIAGCKPTTIRVSLRNDGTQSGWPASAPAVGVDGGHVAFVSADSSIVTGDGNGLADVFLRDVCPSTVSGCMPGTRRISVGAGGADADGASGSPVFTDRYVAFTSTATNLVAGDSNNVADVFLRDTCIGSETACTPSSERISLGNNNLQADGASSEPLVGLPMGSMSGDDYHGRFVVFVSNATNLVTGDTNGVADVFMRDTCRGRTGCVPSTQRVSLTSTGQQIVVKASTQPGHMRWDGEVVLFATAADGVVPEDTNGLADVFMRRVCHDTTSCDATTTRLSVGAQGLQGNGPSYAPRGNHDAWTGPDWATFVSDATNFWPGTVPLAYSGAIFRTTTY